jgi:hypothetical protein
MSKPNPGFDELLKLGNGTYSNAKSFSCVKHFTRDYPEKQDLPFVQDMKFWQRIVESNH